MPNEICDFCGKKVEETWTCSGCKSNYCTDCGYGSRGMCLDCFDSNLEDDDTMLDDDNDDGFDDLDDLEAVGYEKMR